MTYFIEWVLKVWSFMLILIIPYIGIVIKLEKPDKETIGAAIFLILLPYFVYVIYRVVF